MINPVLLVADNTRNVLFQPTSRLVYGGNKDGYPLKRRTPKRKRLDPKRDEKDDRPRS